MIDTQFEKIRAHDIVGIRVIISPEEMTELFDRGFREIVTLLKEEGVAPAGPARAYYFGEISDTVDILIGFPVSQPGAEALRRGALSQSGGNIDDVALHHFREMKTIHRRHSGTAEEVDRTWREILDEAEEHGCRLPAVSIGWEEFSGERARVHPSGEAVTEVFVQVCQLPSIEPV
ncbi:hypothetical protein [Corynebacterium pacaense]|uniref:hypothetical protein n=1 Tax=Corynebacterium pacaense TaxID=1816684 RepID=UPI0009BBE157|nr:hypothetical protein [Corynebacterium pacaense]